MNHSHNDTTLASADLTMKIEVNNDEKEKEVEDNSDEN